MILFIILIGFLLRLVNLDQSLWLDEAININFVKSLSFKELILNYSLSDFHPPLFHVLLKRWISLFGSSEIAIRFPSIIFGVGTVFITYLIGKKLFETSTTLILYSDYLPYVLIPLFVFYLFINRRNIAKGTLRTFVPAFIIIFVLLIPWLVIFPKQLMTGLSAAAASPAWEIGRA